MTCREFADFILEYLSDELTPDSRSSFEHHLEVCPNCQRYLQGYVESVKLGRNAFSDPDAAVPADVPDELVRAIIAAISVV